MLGRYNSTSESLCTALRTLAAFTSACCVSRRKQQKLETKCATTIQVCALLCRRGPCVHNSCA